MYCPRCFLIIPHRKAELNVCTLCGEKMQTTVRDILEDGKFSLVNEIRSSQIKLAEKIENLLRESSGTLLLEGGTGVGKSFAYLLPLLLSRTPQRAVIATAKKTLQDQLATKDLPLLVKKILGPEVPPSSVFTVYKGKSNYACWKMEKNVPPYAQNKYRTFIRHAATTHKPADIANWDGPAPVWWHNASIEHCTLKTKCEHHHYCKPQPHNTPIVVTNHHLMAIDCTANIAGSLLGEYSTLIIDEAHQAPEALRSVLTKSSTLRGVKQIAAIFNHSTPAQEVVDASRITTAKIMRAQLEALSRAFEKLHNIALRHRGEDGSLNAHATAEATEHLYQHTDKLLGTLRSITPNLLTIESDDLSLGVINAARNVLTQIAKRISRVHQNVEHITSVALQPENGNSITQVTPDKISAQPVETGEIFQKYNLAKHTILLSATLTVNQNFKYIRKDFGIPTEDTRCHEGIYPSTFNYTHKQALLYLPQHLPLTAHAGKSAGRKIWLKAITKEICRLVTLTRGRTFVLCSARADMDDFINIIPDSFWTEHNIHPVLQEGSATTALSVYLAYSRGVLFGLKSFWEGIDIPGDKLRMVIVPKLPFPHFKDPLIKALQTRAQSRGENPFFEVQVPRMIFDMKQGLGRLIRTATDRGIAAILDPRVWTATSQPEKHKARLRNIQSDHPRYRNIPMGYGKILVESLPFKSMTPELTQVCRAAKYYFKR